MTLGGIVLAAAMAGTAYEPAEYVPPSQSFEPTVSISISRCVDNFRTYRIEVPPCYGREVVFENNDGTLETITVKKPLIQKAHCNSRIKINYE